MTSRSLSPYFGNTCGLEFFRMWSFFNDLEFGLNRACIAPGAILEEERSRSGHPARESLNGTEGRANERF
jgi:hypothetical protein